MLETGPTRQEEDNHHRVDNGEPVNLDIAHGQVRVPARRPLHLALLHRRNSEVFHVHLLSPVYPGQLKQLRGCKCKWLKALTGIQLLIWKCAASRVFITILK